ncbi:hypothetical protein [Yeosuana marina]|uniref:hypothetical protein n=1 Tax=Yeosuana marina TaxID=1565536 RepID=UPI00141FA152|nr:hypothetical protein [Yeosuana marina]
MEELFTTYTVTGSNTAIVWQFKYRLNGLLAEFKLIEGELDQKQINWLFLKGEFPYLEKQIKGWKCIKNFKIEIGAPDLSFETFWELYNHKLKKIDTERLWKKLSEKDKIDAIVYIKTYNNYLARKGVDKANPYRYLGKRYWEDNHGSIH